MKVETTPWVRASLGESYATLRIMLPETYTLVLLAGSVRGPFQARLRKGRETVALTLHPLDPFQAAMTAVEIAAEDIDEGALARQLAASLRAVGVDPAGIA